MRNSLHYSSDHFHTQRVSMNRHQRQFPLALLISLSLLVVIANAQTMPTRITQRIDDNARTTLPGTTHPAVRISRDLGALSADHPLQRMMLVLKSSEQQQTALQRLLDSQQNKNSPNYHKWLKPADYATQFGPSDGDLAQVVGWLEKRGFEIGNLPEGRQWIEFSGTEKQVEQAFRTSIHALEHNGERHVGNTSDVSLPSVITSKAANSYHFKTGQRRYPGLRCSTPLCLFRQVQSKHLILRLEF
jgi:hypothetical protein